MKTFGFALRLFVGALAVLAMVLLVNQAFTWISSPNDLEVVGGFVVLAAAASAVAALSKLVWRQRMSRGLSLLLVLAVALASAGCTRVDPGHVGIRVNLYGKDRGVSAYPMVTGMVWYNPITTKVLQYPTYVQTASWTSNPTEGRALNDEITFNSREGLVISADVSLSYQLEGERAPAFYVEFRSDDLDRFTHGFLRNVARDSFNEVASTYAVEDLYGTKKEEYLHAVRERINKQVAPFGVELQQFGFIGAPRLPQGVVDALNAKIKATQDAIRVENELRQAEAEAKKRVAQAEGEAKANQLLASSITPTLIEWRRLDIASKWDGKMPVSTGGTLPFLQLPMQGKQ
jgi:regulator of protease activity HflC (stomatin/prohibitin superfamily)